MFGSLRERATLPGAQGVAPTAENSVVRSAVRPHVVSVGKTTGDGGPRVKRVEASTGNGEEGLAGPSYCHLMGETRGI